MIFTAYFDESNTDGSSPDVILAAFLGSARQWEIFLRRFRKLRQQYGFKILHSKKFRHRTGEFAGWSIEKCRALVNDLACLIRDELSEGVSATLPRAIYEQEYRAPPIPKGMNLDSQYGVCFRQSLYLLIQEMSRNKKRHRLYVVIEDGHKNVGDTVRIFNEVKAELGRLGVDILGTITIAKKSECLPLTVADFQAHLGSINDARIKAGQPDYIAMTRSNGERDAVPKSEAALSFITFPPGSLKAMKDNWQRDKDERVAKWRAEREIKRALRKPSSEKEAGEGGR